MNTLHKPHAFAGLGVPAEQLQKIESHIAAAEQHIYYETELDQEQALEWLWSSLHNHMPAEYAELVFAIAERNYVPKPIEYSEQGYDSCQSHRQLSKIVSEAILVGGMIHEAGLVGVHASLQDAQGIIRSDLEISEDEAATLAAITQQFGSRQDFIFPGVTPSTATTANLEDMTYQTLTGKPQTGVRTLTGLGGLRYDRDWNHVTDLGTFAELKVTEDKRYYPGLGVFFLIKQLGVNNLPAAQALKTTAPHTYQALVELERAIKTTRPLDYEGVSVLCAAYLPKWHELKAVQGFASDQAKDLSSNFHSPSYEFASLLGLFNGNISPQQAVAEIQNLQHAMTQAWSFNSTIHLPWASEYSYLSHDLMGKVTNQFGDYGMRYGVGHQGKSFEIVAYHYGQNRRFPFGLAGQTATVLKIYLESEAFEGPCSQIPLPPNHPLWDKIKKTGFLQTALEELQQL